MSKVKIQGHASGTGVLTVTAPNTNDDSTITLPDGTGTLIADDGSGNVGIGEPTPQALLHIKGNTPVIRISDANSTSEDDATGKIEFYDRNTDLNGYIQCGSGSSSDLILNAYNNKAIIFQNNGTTERFRITNDGRGLSQFTAKAWVRFDGTGTVAINDSHNVSSIGDGGTGVFTVNFTNDMANANYSVTSGDENYGIGWDDSYTTGYFKTKRVNSSFTPIDSEKICCHIFGD